jgi:hypothetical protein
MEILTQIKLSLLKEKLEFNTILLYSFYLLSFLTPIVIAKPQMLVGSVINFLIVFCTLKYGFRKTIPVLLLPSIAATSTGILFSGATLFLLYLMPFIMISNTILSGMVSYRRDIVGIILGCILKVGFLFSITTILVNIIGLPSIFLTSMGIFQMYTALIGSTVAYLLFVSSRKAQ